MRKTERTSDEIMSEYREKFPAYYKVSPVVARVLWVVAAFVLLMGVMFGGGYVLHVISMDHWAWFPTAMGIGMITIGAGGLLGYACFKLTDEWGHL